jgi:chromosome partitioning protein
VNPGLKVAGVVLCMHDPASTHVREVVKDLEGFFAQAKDAGPAVPWSGAKVYSPPVRRNIKLAECPSFGQTIFQYAPFCPGALDYKALAERFVQEWDARTPAPAKAPAKAEAPAVTTRRTKAQAAEAKA